MAKVRYPKKPEIAVGAIIVRDKNVLLVKRSQPPGEGLWAIPGGRVQLGETLQQAAEREIMEETRVTIRAGNPVYAFDLIEWDSQGRVRYHYVIVDLMADYLDGVPMPCDDVSEARWVTAEELERLPVSKTTRTVLANTIRFAF